MTGIRSSLARVVGPGFDTVNGDEILVAVLQHYARLCPTSSEPTGARRTAGPSLHCCPLVGHGAQIGRLGGGGKNRV
jgi:hypothetical protein